MLIGHPIPEKRKSIDLIDAFIAGAPRDAVGHVFYGVKEANLDAWQRVLSAREPYYFIDNSYFDIVRSVQFRVTRNAVQHTGNGATDGKRFAALGVLVQKAREPGPEDYVLGIEQSDVFMRLTAQNPAWLRIVLTHFQRFPIKVKPWHWDKPEAMRSLRRDLEGALLVVTHSSAAAVEAQLAGIPTTVSRMSACHSLGLTVAGVQERTRWAGVLADNQFTREELRNGYAWQALHQKAAT